MAGSPDRLPEWLITMRVGYLQQAAEHVMDFRKAPEPPSYPKYYNPWIAGVVLTLNALLIGAEATARYWQIYGDILQEWQKGLTNNS